MRVSKTNFAGLLIIEPNVYEDSRGFFFESYNKKNFGDAGIDIEFVQDNQSHSTKGVVRGFHFQKPPHAQAKLVRAISGTIQDVVVDLRKDQPTFGAHYSIELSVENKKQLLVPAGFAHGFLVLSDYADILYKCDKMYHPGAECGIIFNDPALKIEWKLDVSKLIYSAKDGKYPTFAGSDLFF